MKRIAVIGLGIIIYDCVSEDKVLIEECSDNCENMNMQYLKFHDGYDGHPDECWCVKNNESKRVY